jgi:hypothetical protein
MSPAVVTPAALRVLVTLLAVLATVAQVGYLDALSWGVLGWAVPMSAPLSAPFIAVMTAHAVVSLVSGVLAIVLVLHEGPRHAAARSLALALAAWSYLTAYSGVTHLLRPESGFWRVAFEGHFVGVEFLGLVGLLRFTALFPEPLVGHVREAPASLPRWLHPFHAASLWLLGPWAPWLAAAAVLAALFAITAARGLAPSDAGLNPLMDVTRFAAAAFVVVNLRRSWSRADANGIDRLGWLLVGLSFLTGVLLLLVGGNVLVAVTGWPEPEVAWRPILLDGGLIGFLVASALSVLYRGPVHPVVVARRIGAAAMVGALGLFLAAGLEALFSGGALGGSSLRTGAGTLVAFVIVVSTHRGLVRAIERMLPQLVQTEAAQA